MTQIPMGEEDDSFTSDIFGDVVYEAAIPLKKEFLPWHKPRKQYVRHYQWCAQIGLLIDDIKPEGKQIKYLGLPGVDLLDLRYFHLEICKPRDIALKFLGFNSGASPKNKNQTELNIALDEVRKLSLIDPMSEVIPDDFCLVANPSSLASRKTNKMGPYDIVNLDLCDGFGIHPPGVLDNTYYNAMSRILTLQTKNKNPWLLFLTTRTGKQDIHPDVLQKLLDKYCKNLEDCLAFNDLSTQEWGITDLDSLNEASDNPESHLNIYLASLCKWIINIAISQHPPSKIEVKSTIGYRVDCASDHDDLISIALKFEPTFIPVKDEMGLSNIQSKELSECDLAVKALKRLKKRKCIDEIFKQDAGLLDEMIGSTAKLLESARYDVDAFHSWLQSN